MNFTLERDAFTSEGIFGILKNSSTSDVFHTLEHAFLATNTDSYVPKIPDGTYTCIRGQHRLDHMTSDFTTFEILGIEGHSGLLFHVGNYNRDSDGCVLVGMVRVSTPTISMVSNSKLAFNKFMNTLDGIDTFQLTVSSY